MQRTPTAFEQALLEYVNQARLNPGGEFDAIYSTASNGSLQTQANIARAVEYFGVDLDAFRAQMEAFDPVAPLAWNGALANVATTHSALMIETDTQSHTLPGEASLGSRITDAGYTGWRSVAENIYAYTDDPLFGHAGFMIDWGFDDEDYNGNTLRSNWQDIGDGIQDPAGHRLTILSDRYTDIGIGVLAENDSSTGVGPYVVTQNFGALQGTTPAMLLGVFIDDADGDDFYDIGEGRGGITVTATGAAGTFVTTTWDAGGYQLELAAGNYTVEFSGDSIEGTATYQVTIGADHVKLDSSVADLNPAASGGEDQLSEGEILEGSGTRADDLTGQNGNDVLLGDGLMAAYVPDISSQVFRLYQATLDRAPDVAGYTGWIEEIATNGRDVADIVQGFVRSPEFSARFGNLDNGEFVELLYANVLGRTADAAGLARWTGELDNGADRAQVVLGFSDSAEFSNATDAAALTFADQASPTSWSDDVFRLYQATLDRAPDLNGFVNWTTQLGSGVSFQDVAAGFVGSTEFVSTYANLNNTDFVELLYANVLDRAADAGGLAGWLDGLASGVTRAQVVEGFSQSAEFVASSEDALVEWVRAQGTDDTISGGGGDDILAGGILSDTFVISRATGDSTIIDLEIWDTIDLSAFGYSSSAEALRDFDQQGADVVFDTGSGTVVTLLNADFAALSDEMILV